MSVLAGLKPVLEEFSPDLLLVHGDTTTTLSASLAAYYQQIPVGHVEAGLRTGNIYSPWPEEINRKVAGAIAQLHFAPTEKAALNLKTEAVSADRILITGNTVIDALLDVVQKLEKDPLQSVAFDRAFGIEPLKRLILVTGHRRGSFGQDSNEFALRSQLSQHGKMFKVIYPVHLNPKVKDTVRFRLGELENAIDPATRLSTFCPHNASRRHHPDRLGRRPGRSTFFVKPVLVMRDTTERPEAVEAGTVKLVGTNTSLIVRETTTLLDDQTAYETMARAHNPYGDGSGSQRIRDGILSFLCRQQESTVIPGLHSKYFHKRAGSY